MKKVLLTIVAALWLLPSVAEDLTVTQMEDILKSTLTLDANNDLALTRVVNDLDATKDELYLTALQVFTALYNSGESVIEVKDKETGLIVAKGLFTYGNWDGSRTYISHIVRIDIKDNRARAIVTITTARCVPGSNIPPYTYNMTDMKPYGKRGLRGNSVRILYSAYSQAQETLEQIEARLRNRNAVPQASEDW